MNYFDLIIIILLAWSAYRGFSRGLIIMVATFIALIIGIWGAIRFSDIVSDLLVNTLNASSPYMHLVSFTITFLVIVIGINIAAYLLSRLLDVLALGLINRLLGSVFGILKMALILSVLLVILNAFDERYEFLPANQVENSALYQPVTKLAPGLFPFLKFESITKEIEKLISAVHAHKDYPESRAGLTALNIKTWQVSAQ